VGVRGRPRGRVTAPGWSLFGWWGLGWWCVSVVSAGAPFGGDVCGWGPFGEAVGGGVDLPVGVVGGAVVWGADQDEGVRGGGSAVDPVSPGVDIAPFGGDAAGGEGAPAVPEGYGAAHGAGDGAAGPAHVQGLAVAAEDDGDDFGVAGHPADGAGG